MADIFDIHSHILPGVDDGAMDLEQTLQMLDIAYEEGIRAMIATPHYYLGHKNAESRKLQLLKEQVQQSTPEGFRLYLGNELLYGAGLIEALDKGEALTLAGTRYILIEYLPKIGYEVINQSIRAFQLSGYIPIIAHAERYDCLRRQADHVGDLIQAGAYIQINYSSIGSSIFQPMESFCRKLLDRGWVHFLGTDSHETVSRGPYVRKVITYLKKRYGEEMTRKLVWENPNRILENKHLE